MDKTPPPSLADMMRLLGPNDDDAPPGPRPVAHPIHPQAQAMELRDRFRRAMQRHPLVPGMLCWEKSGMGIYQSARVAMFWRWLDPDDDQDQALIASTIAMRGANRLDCVVGCLTETGDLVTALHESWRLEPCLDFPEDA